MKVAVDVRALQKERSGQIRALRFLQAIITSLVRDPYQGTEVILVGCRSLPSLPPEYDSVQVHYVEDIVADLPSEVAPQITRTLFQAALFATEAVAVITCSFPASYQDILEEEFLSDLANQPARLILLWGTEAKDGYQGANNLDKRDTRSRKLLSYADLVVEVAPGLSQVSTGWLKKNARLLTLEAGEERADAVQRVLATIREMQQKTAASLLSFDLRGVPSDDSDLLPPVALLSPLPPEQSGIADYTVEMLSPLSEHYRLDLYTGDGISPPLPDGYNSQGYSDFVRNVEHGRRAYSTLLYQMGNNCLFHADMYALLMRYAGITVLHDYVLSDLMIGMHNERGELGFRVADELVHDIGGERAKPYLLALANRELAPEHLARDGISFNRRIFTRSLGVIVHNQWSYDRAIREHANDNELITLVPPVMPRVPWDIGAEVVQRLRRKWGVPEDAFVFAPCGIVTPTKRPLPLLDAFRECLQRHPNSFLVFVGSVNMPPDIDFDSEIRRRGLEGKVKISGYVDIPTFNEYLNLADVCITLRYPSQGETSGALLRMLVHGKPSIVTDIGSFGDFPDEIVHKLPSPAGMSHQAEVTMLVDALCLLAEDGDYRRRLSVEGAEYIHREHSPERCARLYADFVSRVLRHPDTRRKLVADWAGRRLARIAPDLSLHALEALLGSLSEALLGPNRFRLEQTAAGIPSETGALLAAGNP